MPYASHYRHLPVCALLCLLATPPAMAEALGRIFYSSEERLLLERNALAETHAEHTGRPGASTTDIRFNGVMRMRNGRTNAWVNGIALDSRAGKSPASTGLQIELRGERLLVRQNGNRQVLRAGESSRHAAPSAQLRSAVR